MPESAGPVEQTEQSKKCRKLSILCLSMLVYAFGTWLLCLALQGKELLRYLCPLMNGGVFSCIFFANLVNGIMGTQHSLIGDLLGLVVFSVIAALPLYGWFLLTRGKVVGLRLIRIPCLLMLSFHILAALLFYGSSAVLSAPLEVGPGQFVFLFAHLAFLLLLLAVLKRWTAWVRFPEKPA